MGQFSLFGSDDLAGDGQGESFLQDEWDKKIRLGFEKEMLGLFVSDHPLFGVESQLRAATTATVGSLREMSDGSIVTIGGLVGAIARRYTKDGKLMLFFQLEDLESSVEVLGFPGVVEEHGGLIREDAVVLVTGRVDQRGDETKFVARSLAEPRLDAESEVRVEVPARILSPEMVKRLKHVLVNHPGPAPVVLHLHSDNGHKVVKLGDDHRVEPRSALYAELRELFGQKAVL